ncbi:MAG: hypothetical protein ABIP04_12585 [Sulfuriferula sp.]
MSDMYGRHGDVAYMDQWSAALVRTGLTTKIVYMDDLLPELYLCSGSAAELHTSLVTSQVWSLAVLRLEEKIAQWQTDLLIGFSYGGYVSFGARKALAQNSTLMCISTTRLRDCLPITSLPTIYAFFGDQDPHRPQNLGNVLKGASFYDETVIHGHGHDLYRDISSCLPPVLEKLKAHRRSRIA